MARLAAKRAARRNRAQLVLLLDALSVAAIVVGLVAGNAFAAAPPAPTVTSGPANPTNQTSASFTFTDTQAGVTFQCSLDGSAFVACTSPQSFAGPPKAAHRSFKEPADAGA